MVQSTRGNLLDADTDALVNAVNTVGVMGKGIALMFKERFPENYAAYAAACKRGEVVTGKMFVTQSLTQPGPKWIVNFPTKQHWRDSSKIEWIRDGLADLAMVVRSRGIKSLAIPPLGCGLGGLEWAVVRPLIMETFDTPGLKVLLYEPSV